MSEYATGKMSFNYGMIDDKANECKSYDRLLEWTKLVKKYPHDFIHSIEKEIEDLSEYIVKILPLELLRKLNDFITKNCEMDEEEDESQIAL